MIQKLKDVKEYKKLNEKKVRISEWKKIFEKEKVWRMRNDNKQSKKRQTEKVKVKKKIS